MANDPYSLCPCGSGKKLKFCCLDILPDIQKAYSLRENQPDIALGLFRDLAQKHPNRDVVVRELVSTLLDAGQVNEAFMRCSEFLKTNPDNPSILLTMAEICLKRDGFQASRRILHRTFQICARAYPGTIAFLASHIAFQMLQQGNFLAAREHLSLAIRMSNGDAQRRLVMQLLELEGDSNIPYVFRSAYPLLTISCSEEAAQQDSRARKLSVLGCWEPASILYNRLADSFPREGAVWYNLGLCQLWDGRLSEAASSLHHAASLLSDQDAATEAEVLAQQIDLQLSEERLWLNSVELKVQSISEVVSRLSEHPALRPSPSHDHSQCDHTPGTAHAAEMVLLKSETPDSEIQYASQLAESLADIDVFDVTDPDEAAEAGIQNPYIVIASSSDMIDTAVVKVREILGELILTRVDEEKREAFNPEPLQAKPFDRRYVLPKGMSQRKFRQLLIEISTKPVEEWLHLPQMVLGGKSALEAAGDATLQTKLAASLIVMQGLALKRDLSPDLAALRTRLQLPPRGPLQIAATSTIAAIPCTSLERLQIDELSVNQVVEFANRASLLGMKDLLRSALLRILDNDEILEAFGAQRACLLNAAIARANDECDLCFAMLDKARTKVPAGSEGFRNRLELDVRELSYRLDDPQDPALRSLLRKIRDQYLHKVPELGDIIADQLRTFHCEYLLAELEASGSIAPASTSALWTPGSDAPANTAGSLWLPGQS